MDRSMNNIAISINDQNLLMKKIKLGGIGSAYEGAKNLPLILSILYGKQWINTKPMKFNYAMNLEIALAN